MPETTSERETIGRLLVNRKWFRDSETTIRAQLYGLPEDFNGFLEDLANRPEQIANLTLLRIAQLFIPKGQRTIIIVFLVKNQNNVQQYFQYVSWKQGPASGAKGIILIQDETTRCITHLILLESLKFGAGMIAFDCIGGFAEADEKHFPEMEKRFQIELLEGLGLETMPPFLQFIDLGRFYPDAGCCNNHPYLFAIVFSSKYLPLFKAPKFSNPDQFEHTLVKIVPIDQLLQFTLDCDDSFFHVCLTRLLANGFVLFKDFDAFKTTH